MAAAVVAAGLTACQSDDDNVFGQSVSERQNQAMADYAAILKGAPNGWVMDFYPADLTLGGVAYTALFDGTDVTMTCEQDINNAYINKQFVAGTPFTSGYRILAEQGIVLSFDTYNPLFHYWSQPSGTDSDGFASDYEFTFVSASANELVLRGKKYGNILRMRPLNEPQDVYINKVAAMRATLKDIPRKRALVDGKAVAVSVMDGYMDYSDAQGQLCETAFLYTATGIRFYESVVLDGVAVSEFMLDASSHDLVSADQRVRLPMPTLLERFCGTIAQWHFVRDAQKKYYTEMSAKVEQVFTEAVNATMKQNWENVDDIYIGANKLPADKDSHRMVIGFTTSISSWSSITYEVCYGVAMSVADEDKLLANVQPTESANLFYNYSMLQPVVDIIGQGSPYRLEFDDSDNPTQVKLTSAADSDLWFVLKK